MAIEASGAVRREVAERMAEAAAEWLGGLDESQRAVAAGAVPDKGASDAERRRWFYTPTDHGGLTLHQQWPVQQRAAMRLVATGLSPAGYVTVATTMRLENVLDQIEGFVAIFDRERGRDPGLYYLRVFGEPGGDRPWGWRFGGHHVSFNNLVIDGVLVSTTPCFIGADPASSPLLGGAVNRPLARVEDLARDLVRSLSPELAARAALLPKAPSDFVTANRTVVSGGDRVLPLAAIWRDERFPDDGEQDKLQQLSDAIDTAVEFEESDHAAVEYTETPKGVSGHDLDADSARCSGRCSERTSTGSPTGSPRRRPRTRPRSTPSTSRGRGPSSPERRTTTGSRGRGCSSSGTTHNATPTTPTRSGATPPPTSVSTCSQPTGPAPPRAGRLRPRRARSRARNQSVPTATYRLAADVQRLCEFVA